MRTIRFIMSIVIAVAAIVVLGSLASARSGVDEDELHIMHPNLWERGINQPCPKGSVKTYKAVLSVPRGQRIREANEFVMLLKSGDVLSATGQRLDRRHVEYQLAARGRKAQVSLRDTRFTLLYGAITGYEYVLSVSSDCAEKLPDME